MQVSFERIPMSDHENEIEMHSYFGRLLTGHSLFRWEILALDENLHEDDQEKLRDGEFSFFNFIFKLVESNKLFMKEDYDSARVSIEQSKQCIEILRDNENCRFASVYKGFKHLIDTSLITILLISKKDEKYCLKLLDSLTASSELNEKEEAAILAVRSACYAMYSYKGTEEALDFIGRAIRKDPVTPFWRFLKATYLYKLRIVSNPIDAPTLEEKDLLKKVNEEEKNDPLFMVYLADVYRESASANSPKKFNFWFVPEESKNDSKMEIQEMFQQARMLYEEAHKLRPECPKIAFRCAHGSMKLPQKYQNIKFAKQIILNLIPNYEESGCGNFAAAYYYHRFGGKPPEAKKYLQTAIKLNVFNAHLKDVNLTFHQDPNKCVEQLEKLLDIFDEEPKRKLIYSQIISYFLFANTKSELSDNDLSLICDYFTSYLKTGGSRSSLENHRSLFFQIAEEATISLLDVVADEVKRARGNQKLNPKFREKLDAFVHSLNFFNICAWKGKSQDLRRSILGGHVPAAKSRCPRPYHPTNQRNNPANNIRQNLNASGEQNPMKWSGPKMQAGFARGQPRGALGQNRGRGRGRNPMPPRPNILPKNEGINVPEIAANRVEKDHVVKTKQKETPQVNLESPNMRTEGVKRRDYIEKERTDRSLEEYRSSRRRSSHDRHARRKKHSSVSSGERSDHSRGRRRGRHQKYSRSSSTDDSYDRYRRKHRRKRSPSSSSDEYGRRNHRRHSHRCEKSSDKLKRGRRHSSVSSDFESRERYRRQERKNQRSNRYRSITSSDSESSEYEKKKSSRRYRGRSPSESEFSERRRKYEKGSDRRGHYRSITPSSKDRRFSKSEKREKESHRPVSPSGSVSSKFRNKKSTRRSRDRSVSESEILTEYRKSEKESHRRARCSITPSNSVPSKYENRKPSRRTRDRSLSESESSERCSKYEKESDRRSHHRSVSPSESASSEYEKREPNRKVKDRRGAESLRERSQKSEEDEKYLSEKIVDLSLFANRDKRSSVQRDTSRRDDHSDSEEAKYKQKSK